MNPDNPAAPIALHYRRQFYQESISVTRRQPGGPAGLVGREVAGRSFLEAFLKHSTHGDADILIHHPDDQRGVQEVLAQHLTPPKRVRLKPIARVDQWAREPGRRVLWEPQPIDPRWTWWRQRMGTGLDPGRAQRSSIALCGVTHTMATPAAAKAIKELVESPVRSCDCVICPSEAVRHTTKTLLDFHSDRMRRDRERIELPHVETIPLGVDCQRHCPATPAQRHEMRRQLGIPGEATVVLFVGRLSHHAKANPLPLMTACQAIAAERAGRIDLVFAGWFANDSIRQAFVSEAARVAPNVRCQFVDGRDPSYRDRVWHAADVFASLADSVQETFGLTITEAISRGLPVIASDWNGYREIVQHDQNGFLIPTQMMDGTLDDAWFAMHETSLNYDGFLAAASQSVAIDQNSLVHHLRKLTSDPELRQRLGTAGRQLALDRFSWPVIMARYEDLWHRQREWTCAESPRHRRPINATEKNETRSGQESTDQPAQDDSPLTIAPTVRDAFDLYPSRWLRDATQVRVAVSSKDLLDRLHASPLARHCPSGRMDLETTRRLVKFIEQSGPTNVSSLLAQATKWLGKDMSSLDRNSLRATVVWCLKYGLVTCHDETLVQRLSVPSPAGSMPNQRLDMTYAITCMGRLDNLKQTLPKLVACGRGRIVVVDYSCPDRCGDWIQANFHSDDVGIVRVTGKERFDRSDAKNQAIRAARTTWVCLLDADIVVQAGFASAVESRLRPDTFLRSDTIREGTGGTFIARRDDLERIGYHDPTYLGWGEEDEDLIEALMFDGIESHTFPGRLIEHLDHDDELRTRFHDEGDRRLTHMINRLYRAAKWDVARLMQRIPTPAERQSLFQHVTNQVRALTSSDDRVEIIVPTGKMNWVPLAADCQRELRYRLNKQPSSEPGAYAIEQT